MIIRKTNFDPQQKLTFVVIATYHNTGFLKLVTTKITVGMPLHTST